MQMTEVKSSDIKAYGYDNYTYKLRVQFIGGGVYEYTAVPPEVVAAFEQAPSKGKYFAQFIKPKYGHKKISG